MQRKRFPLFRSIAILFIFITIILATVQLFSYSRIRNNFPLGLEVGGIPIGGLNYEEAAERIYTVYRSPIELNYDGNLIQVRPGTLGFEPHVENMLAVADNQRVTEPFWSGYWNYLWAREINRINIPLNAEFDEERIREYLRTEIASRYDTPATPPMPVPGTTQFSTGAPGSQMDLDRTTLQLVDALTSPTRRRVTITIDQATTGKPTPAALETLLKQIIDQNGFDGVVEYYLKDLNSGHTVHFAYEEVAGDLPPNIAFSSWSTIKIPVMMSAFKNMDEPLRQDYLDLMEEMIELSENTSTDRLAKAVIEENLSPLIVTDDLHALGLVNTFWSGHFYLGAPLLQRFETTANSRDDISTDPDEYNQTTPADMGMLMEDIYYCAEVGGGSLVAAFPGEVTQTECQLMITYLARNQIAVLIQAGVPAGTTVAHKHGWANENDGLIHTMGDVGIVYTPGGNYVLSIFVYHPVQAVFDPVNYLFSQLSQATYNYFNQ